MIRRLLAPFTAALMGLAAIAHAQTIQVQQLPVAPAPLASSTPFWCAYKIANIYTTAQCQMGQIASTLTGSSNNWTGANAFSNINVTGGTIGAAVSVSVANATGVLASAHGGTAQSAYAKGDIIYASAANTLSKLAIGTTGQVLAVSAGGVPAWNPPVVGTVTSVAVSGGTTGLTTSGGPITASGTITLAGTLAVANGGTGSATQNFVDLTTTQAAIAGVKTFTGQLIGKGTATNDNAAAGYIGEYICAKVTNGGTATGCASNSNAPVSLTASPANIATLPLTAGDWLVCASGRILVPSGAVTAAIFGISSTSATVDNDNDPNGAYFNLVVSFTTGFSVPVGCKRFSTGTSANQYLVASATNGGGSSTGIGIVWAERIR